MTELSGEKVSLHPLGDRDLPELFRMWNDPGFAGEFGGFLPKSWVEFEEFVSGASWFLIGKISREKDDPVGRKLGWISYYLTRSDYPYLFEIGYAMDPNERRKGFTTEAAKLVMDFLFTTKEIVRIESVTDVDNLASQRFLEKNGFKRKGKLRKCSLKKGQYRDEYIYAVLREDWRGNPSF